MNAEIAKIEELKYEAIRKLLDRETDVRGILITAMTKAYEQGVKDGQERKEATPKIDPDDLKEFLKEKCGFGDEELKNCKIRCTVVRLADD